MIGKYASRDMAKGERDLVPALVKRVQLDAERQYVYGSLLAPVVRRYDGQGSNFSDKPSLFINFPFLALKEVGKRQATTMKSLDHEDRTLLQSRYRLQSTKTRDTNQSMTKLSASEVKTCITASDAEKANLFSSAAGELIHVPQLWAVLLSNGRNDALFLQYKVTILQVFLPLKVPSVEMP